MGIRLPSVDDKIKYYHNLQNVLEMASVNNSLNVYSVFQYNDIMFRYKFCGMAFCFKDYTHVMEMHYISFEDEFIVSELENKDK
jgi:hypothetical protein